MTGADSFGRCKQRISNVHAATSYVGRKGICEAAEALRLACRINPLGCQQSGQIVRGKSLERASLLRKLILQPQGDRL